MISFERSRSSRKAGLLTLLGVLLVPLLVAGGFLAATYHSQDRLAKVQAAVVNLDKPVKLNGQLVPLGRQLAGGLVNGGDDAKNPSETNFTWVLSDQDDAASGLSTGKYAAVVTIPKDFSANATSYAKNKADEAQHATLDVQTSKVSGVTDPAVAQAISSAAVGSLNKQLTESYLKNVYVGFNSTKKQFTSVADGATKLANGAGQLSGGIDKTTDGAGQLANGIRQLSGGVGQLSTGVSSLDSGAGKLANGLNQLADGTKALPSQAGQLAAGTRSSADGARQLANGLGKLDSGTSAYVGGVGQYAGGVRQYAAGVKTYRQGVQQAAAGAEQYSQGVSTAYSTLQTVTPHTLDTVCNQAGIQDQQCAAVKQAMAGVLRGTFEPSVVQTAKGRVDSPGLIGGAQGLAGGVQQLSTGAGKLSAGADELGSGGATLASKGHQLSSGIHQLSGGAGKLAGGLDKLADGTGQLAGGLTQLSGGIGQSASGAGQLAAGVGKLDSGASQLASGASKSADGTDQLHTGLVKLGAGGDQLADGTAKLADGLATGAKQIPTYTSADRSALASVVAAPVSSERPDSLFSDVNTTTLLAMLALWLGGLISFLVLRVVPTGGLGSSKSTVRLTAEALAPGVGVAVVQAAVFAVVLQRLLSLDAGDFGRTLAFTAFAAVTFAVVNHALAAWFGGIGRFISVLALALVAAAALTDALPGFIDSLRPVLPITPGLDGLRSVITGGDGAAHAVGVLIAWLVVGCAASLVAVARKRMLPAHALTPSFA